MSKGTTVFRNKISERDLLWNALKNHGLDLIVSNPGDGWTRYRVTNGTGSDITHDMDMKSFKIWLAGFIYAKEGRIRWFKI